MLFPSDCQVHWKYGCLFSCVYKCDYLSPKSDVLFATREVSEDGGKKVKLNQNGIKAALSYCIFHGHGCCIPASAAMTRQPASGFEQGELTTCPCYVRRLTNRWVGGMTSEDAHAHAVVSGSVIRQNNQEQQMCSKRVGGHFWCQDPLRQQKAGI